mmetsp:Transcript_107458/g.186583  ORF Transcript_107458/g.186583 Transcript_107458/m.186583 type:complete len:83 (-) Transcript_107458:37-285(-)
MPASTSSTVAPASANRAAQRAPPVPAPTTTKSQIAAALPPWSSFELAAAVAVVANARATTLTKIAKRMSTTTYNRHAQISIR